MLLYIPCSFLCYPDGSDSSKAAATASEAIQPIDFSHFYTEPKLGNAAPPEIIFQGPLKYFFLDDDAKERAPKGRCQAWGVWGHAPPKNFAEFDLILKTFCAF